MAADDGTLAVFDAGLTCALAEDVAGTTLTFVLRKQGGSGGRV
jgi:hypothetical protein